MVHRGEKARSTEKETSEKSRRRMWRQLSVVLPCLSKEEAFIAKQSQKY